MEEERVSSSDDEIDKFYDDLEALLPFVDYRFCYNLDETGQVDAKDTQAIHVIVPKTIKKEAVKLPFDRSSKRFTILHTISTDGKSLEPFIIIPRKTLKGDFFIYFDKDERNMMKYQENSFITDTLFMYFMEINFMSSLKAKREKIRMKE